MVVLGFTAGSQVQSLVRGKDPTVLWYGQIKRIYCRKFSELQKKQQKLKLLRALMVILWMCVCASVERSMDL